MKKLLAMLIVATMIVSSLGMISFAAEANTNVYNGNNAAAVTVKDGDGFTQWGGGTIKVEANTDYVVTAWSKGSGSVQVMILNTSWSSKLLQKGVKTGTSWQQCEYTFNSGNNTAVVLALGNNVFGSKGTVYVDDIVVAKASDPSTNLVADPGFELGKWDFKKYPGIFDNEFSEVTMANGVATDETVTPPSTGDDDEEDDVTPPSTGDDDNTGDDTTTPDENPNVYEGHYSTEIISRASDGFVFFTSKAIRLEANTDYIISAWSKGGGSPSMRILNATSWKEIKDKGLAGSDKIFQKSEATFNSGSNTSVLFSLCNNPFGGGGTMYVDNVFLAKASAPDVNLVTDPGFEDGTGWDYSKQPTIFSQEYSKIKKDPNEIIFNYIDNEIDQPGGSSARKLYAGHKSAIYVPTGSVDTISQNVTLEANKEYVASFWVRSPEGGKMNLVIKDSSGKSIYTYEITGTASWVRHLPVFTSEAEGTYSYCFESIANDGKEIYLDYAMLYAKQRIDGTKLQHLATNHSFENEGIWVGIEGSYEDGDSGWVTHVSNQGTLGNVSGGIRVMCVGDSITEGVGATNMVGGYKKALYDLYEGVGVDINYVGPKSIGEPNYDAGSGHAGYPGWRIDQVESRIQNWMNLYDPQAILLMIGTNDMLQDSTDNPYAANAPARLESTVDKILAANPDVKLFVASIPPLDNTSKNNKVQAFNATIPDMVATKGENVKFVDIYSAFPSKSNGIGNDYTHPDDTGYQYITDKWFAETSDIVTSLAPSEVVPDEGTAYEGKWSIKYNPWYVSNYKLLTYEMYTKGTIKVEPDTDYTLSMMVKGDQGVSLQTRIQTSWGGGVIKTLNTDAGPMWTKASVTFNTGDAKEIILAMINSCMSTGTMYIDDIQLVKNSTGENLISNSSMELDEEGNRTGWEAPKFPWSFVENDTEVTPPDEPDVPPVNPPVIPPIEEGDYNVEAVYEEAFEQDGKAVVEVKLPAADNGNKTVLVGSNELFYNSQREVYVGIIDASAISGEEITGLSVVAGSPAIFVYGNVDGDYDFEDIEEAIDSSDLAILKAFIKGARKLIGASLMASDLDGDGLSDSSDLMALKNYIKSGKIFGILK